ncbi:hypothetical protein AAC387_Pa02g0909 [Persea americana]
MASRSFFAFALMAVLVGFSLFGESSGAESPSPAPASSAVGVSPPAAVAFLVSMAAFLLGSLSR